MANAGSSEPHIAAAQRRLVHLSGISGRVAATERAIQDAAEHRRESVRADLEKLRDRVNTDRAAADRYRELTLEEAKLARVLATCGEHLCR